MSFNPPLTRKAAISQLGPVVPFLDTVVQRAREQTSAERIAASFPSLVREAHRHRLAGTARWALIADGAVDVSPLFPEGHVLTSTDADHNGGRYVFAFPGGVWTVRREPHTDQEERQYMQDALDGILEQVPVQPKFLRSGAFAYLSVPPNDPAAFVVTHAALTAPIRITFDEFAPEVRVFDKRTVRPTVQARSTRRTVGPEKGGVRGETPKS